MDRGHAASFGALLRRYRVAAELTQEALAERAGLSMRTVSDLERGINLTPRKDTLPLLAEALALDRAARAAFEAAARGLADRAVASDSPALDDTPRNPYKGLRPFAHGDAGDFFGRERLIDELAAAVTGASGAAPRVLAVVGASGAGKSSALLAGLLPRLRGGGAPGNAGWIYLDPLVPGEYPLEALTMALGRVLPDSTLAAIRADLDASARGLHLLAGRLATSADARVVLVVDQFEELFTLTTDESERQRFIDLLVTACTEPRGAALLLLTLRADFYDRPLRYPALGALLAAHHRAVLPMDTAELRAAVEGPAALEDVGVTFEPGLVDALLDEVRAQVGALPLLQFTLAQLFERRAGRCLTLAAYRELGGVRGALARHAERSYGALPTEEHRALARALFLRLIEPGASTQDAARRRAPRDDLTLPDAHRTLLMAEAAEAFVHARLLTATEVAGMTLLEVSHEALIGEWGRLGEWLHEAREDVRLQGRISADAAEWEQRGRPGDSLYRGTVLAEAQGWAGRNTPSARETAFLAAAAAEEYKQAAAERERQARELAMAQRAAVTNRQAATRLRVLVGVLAVFLLAAAGLTALALNSATEAGVAQRSALTNAHVAVAERNVALARLLAAQSGDLLNNQLDLALLLGLEANRRLDSAETRGALLHAVSGDRPFTFLQGHTGTVWHVAFSPDGKTLASASSDGTVRLWDVARGEPLGHPLVGPTATGEMKARMVPIKLVFAGHPFVGHTATVESVAFSFDGTTLASAGDDGTVRLWDVAHERLLGPPLQPMVDSGGASALYTVYSLAFSPKGKVLAVGDANGDITLWDVARGKPLNALRGNPARILTLAFSPDGKILASAGDDGIVSLWDMSRGASLASPLSYDVNLTGHTNLVDGVAFSPDGKTLASASNDGTVRLWNVRTGLQTGSSLTSAAGPQTSVAFSPDGTTLATASGDGTVQLWDVVRRQPLGPPLMGGATADSVAFSPDGTLLAASSNNAILLWKLTRRQPLSVSLTGHTDTVAGLAFSPDSRTLYSSSWDATIRLWDVVQGREIGLPIFAVGAVNALVRSPDGRTLAAEASEQPYLWDVARRRWDGPLNSIPNIGSLWMDLAFSPDGAVLARGNIAGTVELWDVAHRRPLTPWLSGHTGAVHAVAFSPNGRILASGGDDRTVRLWDVAHHRQLGAPLTGHTDGINAVAFSPDGKVVASGSNDSTVRLWDVAHHRLLGPPLRPRIDSIGALAFSPDGTLLATAGEQQIQLWDVTSRQPLGPPLLGHTQWIMSLAFSPDGKTLASASQDKTIRLWDVDVADWKRLACRIANRNLTRQEWRQYLGDEPYHTTCPGLPAGS